MKKSLSIIMIITMLVLVMTGCGDNKTQAYNSQQTENNTNQVTDKNDNNENNTSPEVGDQTNESNEPKVLEDIQLSEQRAGKAWNITDSDGSKIVISAGYTVDTDYVYDITFNVKCNKTQSEYEAMKNFSIDRESRLKALYDDEILVHFKETDEGFEFFVDFDGLEYANREKRISMVEEIIGITANDSDTTFRFSEMDSQLKDLGYVNGA